MKEHHSSEPKKTSLSAEEMSSFYKDFLDRKWSEHLDYNVQWQRRNFRILGLAVRVAIEGWLGRGKKKE